MGVPSVELPSETLRDTQWEILKSGIAEKCSPCGMLNGKRRWEHGPTLSKYVDLHHQAGTAFERDRHAEDVGRSLGLFEELDGEINGLDDTEVEVDVAADSGACAHVFGPDDLPGNVKVNNVVRRRFHGANNSPIEHHGEAVVHLVQEDGTVATSTVQVAEVCRPLHSVSTICDGKKEMLYTDEEAVVVPKGSLSKFLAQCQRLATYPRVGGLYVARVKVRSPQSIPAVKSEDFPRPGRGR